MAKTIEDDMVDAMCALFPGNNRPYNRSLASEFIQIAEAAVREETSRRKRLAKAEPLSRAADAPPATIETSLPEYVELSARFDQLATAYDRCRFHHAFNAQIAISAELGRIKKRLLEIDRLPSRTSLPNP